MGGGDAMQEAETPTTTQGQIIGGIGDRHIEGSVFTGCAELSH